MKEHSSINLDAKQMVSNPGVRPIAVLCLSYLCGKFEPRNILNSVNYFIKLDKYFKFITWCNYEVKSISLVGDKIVRICSVRKEEFTETLKQTNVCVAAWINPS